MAEKQEKQRNIAEEQDDPSQNAVERAVQANHDPESALEEGRNAAEGKSPNAASGSGSSTAEGHVPSNSDPDASDLPSAR
jgi:hypothetical protein